MIKTTQLINMELKRGRTENIERYLSIFDEAKHNSYISHGEVICGRATHDLKWAKDIMTQMKKEFVDYFKNADKYIVFEIYCEDELVGFAIIELYRATRVAVLADIMIKRNYQGGGIGTEAIHKIEGCLKSENIDMILLESGINNKNVHAYFEKNGYAEISVVYSKIIT
ncbi:hypothetical protein FACS1894199_14400 [Bacteroidia bacterium]|nr:hypothetical protein FACS1894199_14400 [Bacteroidia bacterium]